MFNRATIDQLTRNDATGVYSLYLVEPSGWSDLQDRLRTIQQRIYTVFDFVLDGQLASDYPDSKGLWVRLVIRFDSADTPNEVLQMISRLDQIAKTHLEYSPQGIARGLIRGLSVELSNQSSPPTPPAQRG